MKDIGQLTPLSNMGVGVVTHVPFFFILLLLCFGGLKLDLGNSFGHDVSAIIHGTV